MNVVLIPASGVGKRMGGDLPKQFSLLAGKPIMAWSLECFQASPLVDSIIVAAAEEFHQRILALGREFGITKLTEVVTGGDVRQHSVWNAFRAAPSIADVVLVHDAVRPIISVEDIDRVITAAKRHGAAVLALPVSDTIKQGDENGFIENTLDRECLWSAQTPQAFKRDILFGAFQQANNDHFIGTDEASLVEYSGGDVKLIEGSRENIKITSPADILIAGALLSSRV